MTCFTTVPHAVADTCACACYMINNVPMCGFLTDFMVETPHAPTLSLTSGLVTEKAPMPQPTPKASKARDLTSQTSSHLTDTV